MPAAGSRDPPRFTATQSSPSTKPMPLNLPSPAWGVVGGFVRRSMPDAVATFDHMAGFVVPARSPASRTTGFWQGVPRLACSRSSWASPSNRRLAGPSSGRWPRRATGIEQGGTERRLARCVHVVGGRVCRRDGHAAGDQSPPVVGGSADLARLSAWGPSAATRHATEDAAEHPRAPAARHAAPGAGLYGRALRLQRRRLCLSVRLSGGRRALAAGWCQGWRQPPGARVKIGRI